MTIDVDAVLAQMTLEEKVGQMFLLAFAGSQLRAAEHLVRQQGVGGCYLSQDNAATPAEAAALSATLQQFARATRLALPLLLGADHEGVWGVMVPFSATGPGNLALGAARVPDLTRRMYRVLGAELAAVGYNTLLAPCADVNTNPHNPIIGTRSFGEDPAQVATLVRAAVEGAREAGVVTTVKHFPGHGDTVVDSHRGLPRVDRSRAELEATDLRPFRAAIAAGVDIVMTSHILYPALDPAQPATLSRIILEEVLRGALGFEGVILSDSMNMGAMRQHYTPEEAAIRAVLAGVDVLMLAEEHYDHDAATYLEKQLRCIDGVIRAVRDGRIPQARIDTAVRRVLTLKARQPLVADPPTVLAPEAVGRAEHRAIEREAAAAGVTLVRDARHLLPLPAHERVVLVNATPRASYAVLQQTRGIGPNQAVPAFDVFADRLRAVRPTIETLSHEAVAAGGLPPELNAGGTVLVVTEQYPLPGSDFDTAAQHAVVAQLLALVGDRLAVIALRDPYELAQFPQVGTYLCTCSSRPCAAEAAADVVVGRRPALGTLPVSVPGAPGDNP